MQGFRFAMSFLTIFPVGLSQRVDDQVFGKSVKYFPVIGLIIGLLLAAVYIVASPRLSELATSAVIVVGLLIITRAFHLDGLADTFDGLLGGRDKEHALAIMKDSRVGSFGVVAVVSVIALKIVLLASVSEELKVGAIIAFPIIGRWAASYAASTQPYARSGGGLGSAFIEGSSKRGLLLSSIVASAAAAVFLKAFFIVAFVAAFIFVIAFMRSVKKKIGGVTGDILGASIELTETVVLFTMAVVQV